MYSITSSSLLFPIPLKNLEEVCEFLNQLNEDFGTLKVEISELKLKFRKNSRAKFTAKKSWVIIEKTTVKKRSNKGKFQKQDSKTIHDDKS